MNPTPTDGLGDEGDGRCIGAGVKMASKGFLMTAAQLEQEVAGLHGLELGQKLYAETRDYLAAGGSHARAISALSEVYDQLGDEDDRDAVADVIDAVEGFCSPTAAL
jgi:hypothetical protein